jgi:uncharacterized protein (TIGR01777 family)
MRVGITGATGFLGRLLAARLQARGDRVVALARSPDRARESLGPSISVMAWDAAQVPDPEALSRLDAVVHLAGESVVGVWTAAKQARVRNVRVQGTRNLVEGIRRASARPRVLLSSSASGFYGDAGDSVLTEDSPRGQGFLADLCVEWEAEARKAESLGLRVVLLRTTLPLDPGGGILRAMLIPFRLGLGAMLGNGRQWMPWVHREDWLALTLFALDADSVRGPLNLTAPHPATNREFTRALASALGRPAILRAPAFILSRLGAPVREGALVSQRIVPAKALDLGFAFAHPDLAPALRDLLGR